MLLKLGVALLVVALCGAAFFGYHAYSRHRDLAETLQWMDLTYNPHEGGDNLGQGSWMGNPLPAQEQHLRDHRKIPDDLHAGWRLQHRHPRRDFCRGGL
jgi:hypothetical protein